MGNCQAIDNASLLIQHTNGRVDKLYTSVSANEIMKMNPDHYVALLLTTTLYSNKNEANNEAPIRVTKIKLLRPSDTLVLGHVYRLVTAQEVMKGLWAKKQAKMKNQEPAWCSEKKILRQRPSSDTEEKTNQVKQDRHRSRNSSNNWQPSLKSISEAGS